MKKVISILLVLVVILSLYACSNNSSNGLSSEEKKYVGTWENDRYRLHLYDDGTALRHFISSDSFLDGDWPLYGTWEIRENHIIFYYTYDGNSWYEACEIISNILIGDYMKR